MMILDGMVDVNALKLPKRPVAIDKKFLAYLENLAIVNWQPILVKGKWVVDGVQRVLIARKLGIKSIPASVNK
jgi:hypothetical protein